MLPVWTVQAHKNANSMVPEYQEGRSGAPTADGTIYDPTSGGGVVTILLRHSGLPIRLCRMFGWLAKHFFLPGFGYSTRRHRWTSAEAWQGTYLARCLTLPDRARNFVEVTLVGLSPF